MHPLDYAKSLFFLKLGHLIGVSLFSNSVEDYSLTFNVPVGHVAFVRPSVLGAELVTIHFGSPICGGTVPQGMQSNALFEGFLGQAGYLAAEPADWQDLLCHSYFMNI